LRQASELGCCRFTSPAESRRRGKDLERIVAAARDFGIYSNLITSAVLLDQSRVEALGRGWPRSRADQFPRE
jgi:hypothetical protein